MNQIEALDVLTMHALFGDETRARLIAAIAHNGTGDSIEEMLEMVQKALDTMPETD